MFLYSAPSELIAGEYQYTPGCTGGYSYLATSWLKYSLIPNQISKYHIISVLTKVVINSASERSPYIFKII